MAKKKNWNKIITLIFLGMMVVGFSVPAFLDPSTTSATVRPNQKLCQTDSDCYLICDDEPVEVLCSQNLCLQDSCDDNFYYKYQKEPLSFSLLVKVDDEVIDLKERRNPGDLFVTFNDDSVDVFSSGLSIQYILEKVKISLDLQCLTLDGTSYCNEADKELQMLVNGNESDLFENYVPQENDLVEIVYG